MIHTLCFKDIVKGFLKNAGLYHPARNLLCCYRQRAELKRWKEKGCPPAVPHLIKQATLKEYANKYSIKVFVETGTFYGDMVEAMKGYFGKIYSIELSEGYYQAAKERFAGDERIKILHGDSGKEIDKIIKELKEPALFWLDGHYSGGTTARGDKETPVFEELAHIFNAADPGHVIIIDDARDFGTDPAYPTLEELKDFVFSKRNNMKMTVKNDSIRIDFRD